MFRATSSLLTQRSISVLKSVAFTAPHRTSLGGGCAMELIIGRRSPVSKWSRTLSSSKGDKKETKTEEGGTDRQELVLTPGQKVVATTRLTMWAGIFVFASACAYFIARELIPTKMSPNTVFDKSLELVRSSSEVQKRFGTPIKGYGRDHGGHREGRRNFVEHTEYTDEEDGTKRTRVRYNLEGPYGHAYVFAEQSSSMSGGDFVYVLVQDKANGRVMNVVDNRSAMAVKRMAGTSKEGQEAFGNLLSGGSKKA